MLPSPFYFNNGYNDDEALRMAIAQSIEEEIIPPDQRIPLQPNEDHFFEQNIVNPVSERATRLIEMCKKNQDKINKLLSLNINSPISSHNSPKTIRVKKEEQLSSSQEIRREQNEAYMAFLHSFEEDQNEQMTLQNSNNNNNNSDNEENNTQSTDSDQNETQISQQQTSLNSNKNHNQLSDNQNNMELDPEPPDGIIIAIIFPDRSRLSRKFLPNTPALSVYKWCNLQPQLSSFRILDFEIVFPTGELLDMNQTLENQNVLTKSLFNIRFK